MLERMSSPAVLNSKKWLWQLALLWIAASTQLFAICPEMTDEQLSEPLKYVHTLLSTAAMIDNNQDRPETPKDADGFAKMTNAMMDIKLLAGKLTCARDSMHPYVSSQDPKIAKSAQKAERLYDDQITVLNESLRLMKDDSATLSGSLADKMSTIQIKSKEFWTNFSLLISEEPLAVLFSDAKDDKGVRTGLRISAPEHIELNRWLSTAPEFAYQHDKDPRSGGGMMGFYFFEIFLNARPLLHTDGIKFPEKEMVFPNAAGTASGEKQSDQKSDAKGSN